MESNESGVNIVVAADNNMNMISSSDHSNINIISEEQANIVEGGLNIISTAESIPLITTQDEVLMTSNGLQSMDKSNDALDGSGLLSQDQQMNVQIKSQALEEKEMSCLVQDTTNTVRLSVAGLENFRVILGEPFNFYDSHGNKIPMELVETNASNGGEVMQLYVRGDQPTLSLVKQESGSYCLQQVSSNTVLENNVDKVADEVITTEQENTGHEAQGDEEAGTRSCEMQQVGVNPENVSLRDQTTESTHASNITGTRIYSCDICHYRSPYKNNFNRHMTKHNSDQELLVCKHCPFSTIYKHSLKRHMLSHPEDKVEKPFSEYCRSTGVELTDNMAVNSLTGEIEAAAENTNNSTETVNTNLLTCDSCSYKTRNVQHMKRHQMKHINVTKQSNIQKFFTCNTCGYESKYKQHYERHLLKHTGEKDFKCQHCKYATAYIDNYKRHLIKHTKDKSFSCKECNYSSAYLENYKRHMLKHTGEKLYSCPHCTYSSAYSDNYDRHLLKHSNTKHYNCPSCKYTSAYIDNYKRHLLKHSGEKIHSCQYCSYRTVYIDNYRRHVTVHTGEGTQTCKHCGYSTTIRYKFKQHMALHTGEGLIQCPHCPYKTPRHYQMKRHVSIHTQEGRYLCNICPHNTAYRGAHKKHMLKHGKEVDFTGDEVIIKSQDGTTEAKYSTALNTADKSTGQEGVHCKNISESSSLQSSTEVVDVSNDSMKSLPAPVAPTIVAPLPKRSLRQLKSKRSTLARISVNRSLAGNKLHESIASTVARSQVITTISSSNSFNNDIFGRSTSSAGLQTAIVTPMTRPIKQESVRQSLSEIHTVGELSEHVLSEQQHVTLHYDDRQVLASISDLSGGGASQGHHIILSGQRPGTQVTPTDDLGSLSGPLLGVPGLGTSSTADGLPARPSGSGVICSSGDISLAANINMLADEQRATATTCSNYSSRPAVNNSNAAGAPARYQLHDLASIMPVGQLVPVSAVTTHDGDSSGFQHQQVHFHLQAVPDSFIATTSTCEEKHNRNRIESIEQQNAVQDLSNLSGNSAPGQSQIISYPRDLSTPSGQRQVLQIAPSCSSVCLNLTSSTTTTSSVGAAINYSNVASNNIVLVSPSMAANLSAASTSQQPQMGLVHPPSGTFITSLAPQSLQAITPGQIFTTGTHGILIASPTSVATSAFIHQQQQPMFSNTVVASDSTQQIIPQPLAPQFSVATMTTATHTACSGSTQQYSAAQLHIPSRPVQADQAKRIEPDFVKVRDSAPDLRKLGEQ